MKKTKYFIGICVALLLSTTTIFAQDKEAIITLNFAQVDSENVCTATVTSEGLPVPEVNVSLFAKRLLSNLPLEEVATDSLGIASFIVAQDIPSIDGKLILVAKIIDDENYMNTEVVGETNWGMVVAVDNSNFEERSLFAARDKAPIYFIAASIIILTLVWGTLVWALFQVVRIKRLGSKKV